MSAAPRFRVVVGLLTALLIAGCTMDPTAPSSAAEIRPTWVSTPAPAEVEATRVAASPGSASSARPTQTPPPVLSPTPSISPAASPSRAPAKAPAAGPWRPVPDQKAVAKEQFLDVVWTGERFVAAGWGAFLDSVDGITWHRRAKSGAVAVAAGPGGVVAVGGLSSWQSKDGVKWASSAHGLPARHPDATSVADVVATVDGWLAVGVESEMPCASYCSPIRAIAWTSRDGLKWSRVPHQQSLAKAEFATVARAGDLFIAGGSKGRRGVLWRSPDGVTWSRIAGATFASASGRDFMTSVTGVAARENVIVAVGMDGSQESSRARAWWVSGDGAWASAKVEQPRRGQILSVTTTPDGFLAVGPSDGGGCRGGIWESASAASWRCIAQKRAFDGFLPSAAAASDSIEIAVGLTNAGWNEDSGDGMPGAVWWRSRR